MLDEGITRGLAEIGGAKFYYEIAGEGAPLVLVHAGIADRRMWDEQFADFARHYRVIRYDRRGFGETETVAEPYSHHRDLSDLLDFLGLERAFLVGCSQGGKTIIDFTLEHPGRTRGLILVASALSGFTFAEAMPRQWRELEMADEAGDVERVNELELQIWVDGPQRRPEQVDRNVRERVRLMNYIALKKSVETGEEQALEPPAVGRLGELRVPTLIIIGDLDTRRTQATADFLAEQIAGARKVVMEGTAHLPNMERPQEFNHHVLTFLSGDG
ncbi:MAG TPA: alpha/beta hydrolase [Pyrinomonadaceae bacterium]|nr:alpha/beta hydrolase [Pyrinomonadaceae bacterium]